MNYLNLIPTELHTEIGLYIDYIDSNKLRETFGINLNYQYLLSVKFPAFYIIVKTVKERAINYKDYPYSEAYDLIHLVKVYLQYRHIEESKHRDPLYYDEDMLYEDDISEFTGYIFDLDVNVKNIKDICSAYNTIIEQIHPELYTLRSEFPNIDNIDDDF